MRRLIGSRSLVGLGALVLAIWASVSDVAPLKEAWGKDKAVSLAGGESRKISYLQEVRPILAQHCFQCHGPDEAARKGKLRLDLKENAFAERNGKHVIAAGHLDDSLLWERIKTDVDSKRMPPPGKAEPLKEKHIATLKAWVEQGARWEDHWSFLPPTKPAIPAVSDKAWVRDPLDAFVLARLDKEHLKPESEASRAAWLRRASFDLTGLPPTPAEIDEFLRDKSADAYEKQADRLLASPRYGERQAAEWLDLARYADTSGYQNDFPRKIWKWREWVINAYNANMPFNQFAIEQLAGDLLPNATLSQKVATGFNRNHPTNSEAGEEEDEYRSVYVVDRVNTTATVFMGLTLACAQCHDHKYDPITQKDYYAFYSFFNNIKERDSDFPARPTMPVPNPDQEPRLVDLKTRIDALKQRLDRQDALADVAQKEWEKKTLARLGKPVAWTIAQPSGMVSRNGSLLKLLDDGSILSTGAAPVKDTYDVMVLPGKKHITALRLEVLPDDRQPEKGLGRASDGRFILSALEIRNTTFSESQDPPLVYVSRAEADLNQKPKEDPAAYDMMPGPIESAIVVEPLGSGTGERGGGGWSIVDDERRKPHEAIILPLEPLDTNEASVIRFSLHHTSSGKFKSLIGRFRISYTEEERIREHFLPAQTKLWSSVGPFPAEDVVKAYTTAFEPEKDIKTEPLDLKKSYKKIILPPPAQPGKGPDAPGGKPEAKPEEGATAAAPAAAKQESEKPEGDKPAPVKPPSEKEEPAQAQVAKPSENAAKPNADGKPAAPGEVKKAKPGTEEKKPAKEEAKSEAPKAEAKDATDAKKPEPKPEKITWAEQRKWRDGSSANLQGANSAYYLTRKITSTHPRTAMVHVDGPAGFKMWVNGEVVHASEPPPPPPPPAPAKKPDVKPAGGDKDADAKKDDEEPAGPDPDSFDFEAMMRNRSKTETKFRIGLRQGENEIVVKIVFGKGGPANPRFMIFGGDMAPPMGPGRSNGGSFMFNLVPEGEDVITHEVATALRLEGSEQGKSAAPMPVVSAPAPASPSNTSASKSNETPTTPPGAPPPTAKTTPPAGLENAAGKHGPQVRETREARETATVAIPPKADLKLPAKEAEEKKASLVGEKAGPLKSYEEENKLSPSERRQKVLREYFRSHIDSIGRILAEELDKLKDEEKQLKRKIPETLVMEELDKPRQAYIFKRGLYKNRGENVNSATPAVLPPMTVGQPRNRLGLAQWLVSGQHPLTARVLVNRIWKQYFGFGIVRTAEDFGVRASLPTHPELLDYLATELVDSKWDLKKLHKRIVLSATYRQGSAASKGKLERDPENMLLARGPKLRLSAEMVRDNALAVSGLLVEKIGGESVKPVQPKNAWKTVEGNFDGAYRRDRDEKQYRRALYVYWKRGSPYPSMLNFDAVKRDSCTVTRATTTTPLQALTLLNDPVYVECAKMLGQRMLKDPEALGRSRDLKKPEEDARRLAYGFRLCTSRPPTEKETEILRKLLDDQRAHFKGDAKAAKKLLGVGDAKVDATLDTGEAAAWTSVGNALLNLDATIRR